MSPVGTTPNVDRVSLPDKLPPLAVPLTVAGTLRPSGPHPRDLLASDGPGVPGAVRGFRRARSPFTGTAAT